MTYRDRLRQALNWWCSVAPLRAGHSERDRAVVKAVLRRRLTPSRPEG